MFGVDHPGSIAFDGFDASRRVCDYIAMSGKVLRMPPVFWYGETSGMRALHAWVRKNGFAVNGLRMARSRCLGTSASRAL